MTMALWWWRDGKYGETEDDIEGGAVMVKGWQIWWNWWRDNNDGETDDDIEGGVMTMAHVMKGW